MIPITRKELYLNKIVGNNEYETPEKPITTEEFFFAEILGEAVQAPEPLPRYQIYLAKIAGRNIEIPYPETRLEYFLAKACGMDVETPTPITREEIFWSNYSAIVDFEVEGVPPLTYKAIEGTLENYRIYGNTVDGESVGDRTANLFDISTVTKDQYINAEGIETSTESYDSAVRLSHSDFIAVPSGNYITMQYTGDVLETNQAATLSFCWYNANKSFITRTEFILYLIWNNTHTQYTMSAIAPEGISYCIVNIAGYNNTNRHYMLNSGSTALPYEPYGYKVPMTVSNGTDTLTTPIYLPEQIKKVGGEAEYIDYGTQKQHRVRKNLFDGTIDVDNKIIDLAGETTPNNKYAISEYIPVEPNMSYTYHFYHNIAENRATYSITEYDRNKNLIQPMTLHDITEKRDYVVIFTTHSDTAYIRINWKKPYDEDVMLNEGSTALPYEPYIENTDLDVTLPALPTLTGTNVMSVGTAVQPSKVYIKGEKEREYS